MRLKGESLQKEADADYQKYLQECKAENRAPTKPPVARRNQFLSARFNEEPEEYKKFVYGSRKENPPGVPGSVLKALLDNENPLEEEERREHARLIHV